MTDAPVRPPPQSHPRRLADFEIIRRLGAGGMAEVFLAKKRGAEGTFKLLVLKRILPAYGSSRRFRTMFAEEAQLATRLNHPNIVPVHYNISAGGFNPDRISSSNGWNCISVFQRCIITTFY